MGKFHRILEPGLNLLWPVVDKIKYVQSLKEIAIDVPKQSAITSDNVTLSIDGVLYLRIIDPYLGKSFEIVIGSSNYTKYDVESYLSICTSLRQHTSLVLLINS